MKVKTVLAVAAAVALAAVFAPPASAKEWTKVVIATEGAYAPYNLVRPDGKLDGYEIELGNNLCGRRQAGMLPSSPPSGTASSPACRPASTTPSWTV